MTQPRGRFVTLEGGEGVGKSTQVQRLVAALGERGQAAIATREPGGTPGAEAIRALLLGGDAGRWSDRSEALLFAAARCDHVERVIAPALERGIWVVCDRYLDSTRAYQGARGVVADADLVALHALGARIQPDRTLLLTLPSDEGVRRAERRDAGQRDRFMAREDDYLRRVTAQFERIAAQEGERIVTIRADGDEGQVTARLLAALEDLL